jgi:hypothetical protein
MTEIVGTWRFVRAVSRDGNGNALPPPYGGQGMGRIVAGADGRLSVMMIDGRPVVPAGEKREYSGYSGTYTYDGKKLITHVDAAPDPSRIGTDQARDVRFEDGLMVLRPPVRAHGAAAVEQRELYWERIAPV